MFYLFTKSILIEIGISNNNNYYIGDASYDSIPASIIANSYSSANWNRALKYKISKVPKDKIDHKYFMLDVNIYWNLKANKIELISDIFFFNEIINAQHFTTTFLDLMFTHYFKHTLTFSEVKNIDTKFIETFKPEICKNNLRIENVNNFLVLNENFDYENKKFKSISTLKGNEFDWKANKLNQIIYTFPKNKFNKIPLMEVTDFIDLNKSEFYINSISEINTKLILELTVFNHKCNADILKIMIEIINKSNDKLKNWHLYNLTNDSTYLINELSEIKKLDVEKDVYLKHVYSELRRNYDKDIANIMKIDN
ncbi:hypothetical protein [Mesoplasma melaleucae]|uniref:Uncharacterized protein n=1 Tax=Mesoplasma melaleucae TaxID=81459 RepID=A0A2K8NWU3_9MOLU|nr:hypothetical protein [Mesoplasma melaleucae]ATZ18315.1 hypothetical protein EMELA_v1c08290 [Mesoplasma melaleucae]